MTLKSYMTLKSLLLNVRKMSALALISVAPASVSAPTSAARISGSFPVGALVVGGLVCSALAGCGTPGLLAPKGRPESARIQLGEYAGGHSATALPSYAGIGASARHGTDITGVFPLPSGAGADALTVGKGGEVLVWDLASDSGRKVADVGHVDVVTLGKGGALLAKAHGSSISIFALPGGREIATIGRIKARATSLELDAAGETLLIGAADARIYRWRFGSAPGTEEEMERSLERYVGPASVVNQVRYHPFGRVFFAGDWDGRIYAFLGYDADPFAGEYDENLFGKRFFSEAAVKSRGSSHESSPVEHMAVSADGEAVSITTQSGGLEHWLVRGFKRVARIDAHRGLVTAHALRGDGKEAATAGRDGKLRLWKIKEERESEDAPSIFTIEEKGGRDLFGVRHLVYLADGALVAGQGRRLTRISTDRDDSNEQ